MTTMETPRDKPTPTAAVDARFLGRLLDQSAQPFVAVDPEQRLVRTNPAFERLTGYSAAELAEAGALQNLIPATNEAAHAAAVRKVEETGVSGRFDGEIRTRDGRIVPVEVALSLIRDAGDGPPLGLVAFVTDQTERRRHEQALRADRERFRSLFDEAPFGYHEIDAEGTIVDVNRTECDLIGYTRDQMIGRPIFDFVEPENRDAARAAVAERIAEADPGPPVERMYLTADGRRVPMQIENRLLRDADGHVVGIRSTLQDISRRLQAEAALVAAERRARALFEGIEDAVFVHDLEGKILDANAAACRRLGYTRAELLGMTTRDIDDPEFAAGYEDRLESQLREGHLRVEGRHLTKDGRSIPVDINTSTIQLEDQVVVLAVIRDISERKALEETRRDFAEAQLRNAWEIEAKNRALVQSESRYRQLTEGTLDAVVLADADGRITLFNPAAERTFGYTADEVIGRPLIDLMPEDLRGDLLTGLQDYLSARGGRLVGRTVELRGRRKDGTTFPLEISLGAIEVAGELQFLGAIRDQTERQRMRDVLAQSEKLASIGLLSAGVAHEINNPLAYIANNLAVLERDLAGILAMMAAYESAHPELLKAAPEAMAKVNELAEDLDWPYVRANLPRMIGRTREGVGRVANIVQNLRGLARTGPPRKEPAKLGDLVAGALDMVQGRLRKSHVEVTVDDRAEAKVPCVPQQIGQVLLNLFVNAVQAMESVEREEGNRLRVAIQTTPDGGQVVEIADTGPGIPPDALPHLFDPFFTTKPVGEGTGLGLSISHGIITGHGGRIEVETRAGVGTTFRVYLPR